MSIRDRSYGPERLGRGASPSSRRPNLPRFRVILHRTPGRDLPSVVRVLRDVLRIADAEATFRMWESHRQGYVPLLVTHQERAELYAEQFESRGLCMSIEPVE